MSTARAVPTAALRRIVELALRAPSVHNTQPWRWRAIDSGLELHADHARALPSTDPDGRNLVISCGTALHHAQVVGAALGWACAVTRYPDPRDPDLVARLDLSPAPPIPEAKAVLEAVVSRCTDRRRFTSWPVPEERLEQLALEATRWGTMAKPLHDVTERFRAERLIMRAVDEQAARQTVLVERDNWLERSSVDGIPRTVLQESSSADGAYRTRFEDTPDSDYQGQDVQVADGLIVLYDSDDDRASWLRAGEGLSALWLAATRGGLSIVPLSQVIEEEQTRNAFRTEVLHGLGRPLIVTRVGWQAIGRSHLVRTPRRPVSEVLLPS